MVSAHTEGSEPIYSTSRFLILIMSVGGAQRSRCFASTDEEVMIKGELGCCTVSSGAEIFPALFVTEDFEQNDLERSSKRKILYQQKSNAPRQEAALVFYHIYNGKILL